jgi:uncharacterized DUF497 family protein
MEFDWDAQKAAVNFDQYGAAFEDVESALWEKALILLDSRMNYREARFIAYLPLNQRLHVCVYRPRTIQKNDQYSKGQPSRTRDL